jgi:TPR repeat protein
MIYINEIFKRNLGLVSLAVLASLLCSPQAFSMEVEIPEKGLKRKCEDFLEEDTGSKKLCLEEDETKSDDEIAQDRMMKRLKNSYQYAEDAPEKIGFMNWKNIHDRVYSNPDYGNYVVSYFKEIGQNFPNLAKATRDLAKKGNADASYNYGWMCQYGFGVESDPNKSFKYYKLSAKGNSLYGQNNLALNYANGIGCFKDVKKSFKYSKLSADQGNFIAQYNVANLYKQGIGVDQDLVQAFKYTKLSAEQTFALAQCQLADMYLLGLGVNKDLLMAAGLFYKAITNQNSPLSTADQAVAKNKLSSLLTFIKPTDEQKDSDSIDIDLDDFHAKTHVLSYHMGVNVARHSNEVELDPNTLSCKSLSAIYESLANYGGEMDRMAKTIKENLKNPEFMITCVQTTEEVQKNHKGLWSTSEICASLINGKRYFTMGDENPALVHCFLNFIQKRIDILKTIQSLKGMLNVQKQTLENLVRSKPNLNLKGEIDQAEEELKLLPLAEKAMNEQIRYLMDVIVETAEDRNRAFWDTRSRFFQ